MDSNTRINVSSCSTQAEFDETEHIPDLADVGIIKLQLNNSAWCLSAFFGASGRQTDVGISVIYVKPSLARLVQDNIKKIGSC